MGIYALLLQLFLFFCFGDLMFFKPASLFFATSLILSAAAHAEEGGGLSESETSYVGAVILEGGVDVVAESYENGDFTLGENGQTNYAYWSGNTLYVGAEDEFGNGMDGIVEFFWFESSIDRGSDFYVAVIKARTTPNVLDDWYLEKNDSHPVQQVSALTDISRGTSAFRWDWSLPFENYGMDSYGQVSMKNSYGIGGSAEGSAMAAKKVDAEGASAEVSVQAKGYVSSEYNVTTQYTVELWSWYTRVRGAPNEMTWSITLDNKTKTEESAYHEYFLVMQSEEGVPFTIDSLTLGASVDEWWWGVWNQFSIQVNNITLSQPPFDPEEEEEPEPEEEEEPEPEEEDTGDGLVWDTGNADLDLDEEEDEAENSGVMRVACSSVGSASQAIPLAWMLIAMGGALVRRRRS